MNTILGISGSLRKESYNSALLQAAKNKFPEVIETGDIRDIPLYNEDIETTAFPGSVLELKRQLIAAAGLLIVTPEYNSSMPGVLKNVIDWLSRPSLDVRNVFRNKPVAVIGASPGGFGTILSQSAWLPVFLGLGARQFTGERLMVSGASRVFGGGELHDESINQRLENYVQAFMDFCEI